MVEQSILKYVKDSLAKGMSLAQIKKNLRASGWADEDINEAVNVAGSKQTEKTPGVAPPKNIWIFIGIFAVVAVIAAIVLIFFFIGGEEEGEISPTCYETGGYVCSSGETCEENYLEASDTSRCCPEICVPVCVEDWECTNWTECISHSQTRNCTELSNCGTIYDKPDESQVCGYQNLSCVGGDGCDLSCVNQGGDLDCSCVELNNATTQNITLYGEGETCEGTILNSSDTGVCCLLSSCRADDICVLNCSQTTGDPDCGCEAQGAFLSKNVFLCYTNAQVCNGTTIFSSNETGSPYYKKCCVGNCVVPKCNSVVPTDGFCKKDCVNGDLDCSCEEQEKAGCLLEGLNHTDACGSIGFILSLEYPGAGLPGFYCCRWGPNCPDWETA